MGWNHQLEHISCVFSTAFVPQNIHPPFFRKRFPTGKLPGKRGIPLCWKLPFRCRVGGVGYRRCRLTVIFRWPWMSRDFGLERNKRKKVMENDGHDDHDVWNLWNLQTDWVDSKIGWPEIFHLNASCSRSEFHIVVAPDYFNKWTYRDTPNISEWLGCPGVFPRIFMTRRRLGSIPWQTWQIVAYYFLLNERWPNNPM